MIKGPIQQEDIENIYTPNVEAPIKTNVADCKGRG